MSQIDILKSAGLGLTTDIEPGQIIDWDQLDKK